jgi:hypothetical protein
VTLISEVEERDGYKLLPQSHSPRINYSLFIMVPKEMVSMKVKGQLRAAPIASSLLSSQSADPYCVFHVTPPPHREISWGVPFIAGFRSKQFHNGKVCSSGTHEAPDGPHHAAKKSGHVVGVLVCTLWHSPLTSSSHGPSLSRKMTWQKRLGPFYFRRSLKVKNMQK